MRRYLTVSTIACALCGAWWLGLSAQRSDKHRAGWIAGTKRPRPVLEAPNGD